MPRRAAPVTLERAGRYFSLLCELGLADALDQARSTAKPERPRGRAVTSMQESAAAVQLDEPGGELQVDMARMLRQVGEHGALDRLGTILFDVSIEEARQLTAEEVAGAYYPFVAASWGIISMLLDSLVE